MSSQPLNTEILIYRNVRAMRNRRLHDSVASVTKRLRPLIMSVPNRDMNTATYLTRDTAKKDFSTWARDGQPIVVGLYGDLSFSDALENMTGVDFSFQIGQDRFITNTTTGLTRDLQKDLRTAQDSKKITNETV